MVKWMTDANNASNVISEVKRTPLAAMTHLLISTKGALRGPITYITTVERHWNYWNEIWALTDHEIYYIKIELDLRKFSNGPFSETEKGFWVNPTPGGSQCTGLSPTLSWKWPRATLSPSFGPFFERNHSFGVKMVSENVWKTFKSCPWSWNPTGKKQIYTTGKRSYRTGHICKLFHFALSLKKAITPERVAWLTWFFGSMPKIEIYDHLIF